jgi:hypothetical protein
VDFGEAEAAFFVVVTAFFASNAGVDEDKFLVFLSRVAFRVDDEEPVREADLVSGKPDAAGGVHELEHLLDDVAEFGVDTHEFAGFAPQCRVRMGDDLERIHGDILRSLGL